MPAFQQPIMSMEEDDVSDQEIVSYPQIYESVNHAFQNLWIFVLLIY